METKKNVVAQQKKGVKTVLTGVSAGAVAFASTASNAALDVAPLTTEISANGTSMEAVMLAVLTLVALFVGYRMIKRSMS